MASARLSPFVAAVWALACGCQFTRAPTGIDSEMASCIPPGAVVVAGVHLDQLRATPIYQSLQPQSLTGFQSLRDTSELMVAYDTRKVIFFGRG